MILDSDAVIALSRGDQTARAVLTAAWEAHVDVVVPSVVVAETVRGVAGDAPVNRVLKAIGKATDLDDATARIAGNLLGGTGSSATIDAIVVATGIQRGGAVILTSDPTDLRTLADVHPEIVIRSLARPGGGLRRR